MFRWIPYAMVRITAFFAAGIVAGIQWPEFISPWAVILTMALLFLYLISVVLLNNSRGLRIVSGVIGLAAVFAAGGAQVLNCTDARDPSHISHVSKPIDAYVAVVAGAPEVKPNSVRVEIAIEKVKCRNSWIAATGKCLVYVSKKQNPDSLLPGDKVFIAGTPSVVPPPANPGEFDNKRFLSFKNIGHQQFIRADQIHRVGHSNYRGLFYYSQRIRARASAIIQQFVTGKQNQIIARALVLGVTDGIDNELRSAYAASGAMHILSVSGLHVGIIYAIVVFLLKPLGHFSWGRWLVAAISLACLWSYAFITGLSPSVLRAVAMISFVVVARPLARDTNIYNTLAASAFLLLMYDPYLIMSVGFQLSYLAVAGIVYLQRPLYRLWEAPNVFWDKVWQATSVSLAAQLATFSLGLFYFHQFPVYFLFSNLVVIPLSVGVLVIGVLLLVVSPIAWAAGAVGLLLQYMIIVLNGVVFFVERLPFSVINGVTITSLQCVLQMGMIVLVIRLFETRKFKFLLWTFVLLVVFTVVEWRNSVP